MNTLNSIAVSEDGENLSDPGIAILYDDRTTGIRGVSFARKLQAALGGPSNFSPACWRSELMELPVIAEEAALCAHQSEFVILSLAGSRGFSEAMKRWIETWLENTRGTSACLVALFDAEQSNAAHAGSARYYLCQVAAEAEVAFFSHLSVVSECEPEAVSLWESCATAKRRTGRRPRLAHSPRPPSMRAA